MESFEIIASLMYYALLVGLDESTKLLREKGADINTWGGQYGNALHATSFNGHDRIVQQQLDKGVDIIAQEGEYRRNWCLRHNKMHDPRNYKCSSELRLTAIYIFSLSL